MDHDVIIVGGSYAGMAAALQLLRARRTVLVIDAGKRRNRFASHSHGFLTQDGATPESIVAKAGMQLVKYPTLSWIEGEASAAQQIDSGFEVTMESGATYSAKRLILATGVTDTLPEITGLAERWGQSVFHCPYCHGFELDQGRIGVIAVGPLSMHHGLMLPDWGETTLLLNDSFSPDDEQRSQLALRGTAIEPARITEISGNADVHLAGGRVLLFDGLFVAPHTAPTGNLARQLGCAYEDSPMGQFISTNAMKETTVPFVFACGDAARAAGSVTFAVGDGHMAGSAVHQSLMFR
jgi:thioredoxin reductase